MAATETPITELTPVYTDPAVLQGKAVLVHDPTTGDGIVFDASKLDPSEKYQKPSTGIPKTDLAEGVQESLEKADTALQPVETATEDNLASFDADGKVKDSGIPSTKIAEIESEVLTLGNSAGIAEGIADSISAGTAQEITFRKSGGDGVNYIKAIKGKTLAWNQLAETNGPLSLVATTDKTYYGIVGNLTKPVSIPSGHKYYMAADVNRTISGDDAISVGLGASLTYINLEQGESNGRKSAIATADSNLTSSSFYYNNYSSKRGLTAGDSIEINNIVVHDLTLMFGAGNEPSTVEAFESMFPEAYYAYNAGALISNDAEALETVGLNQFDESTLIFDKWRDSNNVEQDIAGRRRSDVFFPALSNTDYYIKGDGVGNFSAVICWYDSNKAFISGNNCGLGAVVTSPANAVFFRISSAEPNTPIIVNLSDASKNGTYEPYWKRTINLGLDSFKVKDGQGNVLTITGGLKSAGYVYDEIVGNKYVKRVGTVDLGTLNWAKHEGTTDEYDYFDAPLTTKVSTQILSVKYVFDGIGASSGSNLGCYCSGTVIRIRDLAYSEAATFKTAKAGEYLYFELAAPIEYELVEPIPNSILVDELGTERAIFPTHEDGSPSAPLCTDSNYSISVKNLVEKLNSLNNS